ncbi:sel1 repeat family protein [Acinetobacter thermotolerans]|uniref:tetratricopeptide repeat protein n=1 Tax=Acinetobacter thermotolerans TaxID=3151487 RepID=UPI00325B9564
MLKTIINFLLSRDDTTATKIKSSSETHTYYLQALQFESLCHTLQQLQKKRFDVVRFEQQQTYQRNAVCNFLSAALRGHPEAQYRLGIYYLNGELGLEQNETQARQWLNQAAQQGHSKAEKLLNPPYRPLLI